MMTKKSSCYDLLLCKESFCLFHNLAIIHVRQKVIFDSDSDEQEVSQVLPIPDKIVILSSAIIKSKNIVFMMGFSIDSKGNSLVCIFCFAGLLLFFAVVKIIFLSLKSVALSYQPCRTPSCRL
jgi:hypothetical protein